MNNYFIKLQSRVDKYNRKYHNRPRKAAFKLMVWNLKCLLKKHKIKTQSETTQRKDSSNFPGKTELKNSPLNIGFSMYGGLGDQLIAINYLKKFKNYNGLTNSFFTIYASNTELVKSLLPKELLGIHMIQSNGDDITAENYDLFIQLIRFPEVCFYCEERIKKFPRLLDIVKKYNVFREHNYDIVSRDWRLGDSIVNMFCLNKGKSRLQQPDIDEILGIQKSFSITPNISLNEKTVLKKFNLDGKKFITINRNTDLSYYKESTKLWPVEYYNELIKLIREKYKDYIFVQLGVSEERCPSFSAIDINLIGQTSLEDLKVVLKNATLHIDNEGGLTHLRRALTDKKSLVLFGPTDVKVYGYDNNINLKMPVCPIACEWLTKDWNTVCMKTNCSVASCMQQLMPEFVFAQIQKSEVLK